MALVNCHECNKQVSDSALTCPNCGAPVRATQKRIIKWNLTVFAIGMVLILLVGIGGCLVQKKLMQNFQLTPPPTAQRTLSLWIISTLESSMKSKLN